MADAKLGFWARLWLAFVLPWKILFNGALAARVRLVTQGAPVAELSGSPMEVSEEEAEVTAEMAQGIAPEIAPEALGPDPTPALQLLSIMQREGRFIDFLQEDVSAYSDADIGAAARVVHEGCRRGLREYLVLEPVRKEAEGDTVVLEKGFDARRIRLTGNVVGEPPFRGQLAHHGWQVNEIRLPTLTNGHDPKVVAPAEVELK